MKLGLKISKMNLYSSCKLASERSVQSVVFTSGEKTETGVVVVYNRPLLQEILRHLNALRRAGDGDDAVGGAGQRLGDLDSGAALGADLTYAGAGLAYYRAGQLQRK